MTLTALRPSRFPAWPVELFASAEQAESILGDLQEEFSEVASKSGGFCRSISLFCLLQNARSSGHPRRRSSRQKHETSFVAPGRNDLICQ